MPVWGVKFFQEMICSWFLMALLIDIRREKRSRFLVFILVWSVISWGTNILAEDANAASGLWVWPLRNAIVAVLPFVLNLVFDCGWIRGLFMLTITDVYLSSVTILVLKGVSLWKHIPFAEVYNSADLAYAPGTIAANFLVSFLLMFCLRRALRHYRSIAIEQYPAVKAGACLLYVVIMGPAVYKVSVTGSGNNDLRGFAPYFVTLCLVVLFAVYYSRTELLRRQNTMILRQQQMLREQMELAAEQAEMTRRLRHDIKRHLRALEWAQQSAPDTDAAAIDRYRNRLSGILESVSGADYGGGTSGNAMLSILDRYCERQGIPCAIALKNLEMDAFSEGTKMNLLFCGVYWIMQCSRALGEKVHAAGVSGGQTIGVNRIVFRIAYEPEAGQTNDEQMLHRINDLAEKQIRSILKDKGEVQMRSETGSGTDREESLGISW